MLPSRSSWSGWKRRRARVAIGPESVHRFSASIGRDDLIGSRLRAVAETLCDGSLTPLLSHLVRSQGLSREEISALRELIGDGFEKSSP